MVTRDFCRRRNAAGSGRSGGIVRRSGRCVAGREDRSRCRLVECVAVDDSVGFAAAGDTIGLGFLVTNTGNASLTAVGVVDTVEGTAVPVHCTSSVLLPGAQTACHASYNATAADVPARSITSSATATDYPNQNQGQHNRESVSTRSTAPPRTGVFSQAMRHVRKTTRRQIRNLSALMRHESPLPAPPSWLHRRVGLSRS